MKTIPPPCPEPETGPKYWRSLDQLSENPEFQQWVEREFPAGASEMSDPLTRRHFVKIMSASFMLAGIGLSGCRRPEEHILPFSNMPAGYTHGVPQFYATAMPTRSTAIPLVVESHDGRPTKIEGNKLHPDSNGGTDHFAQASILSLYDPDRAMRYRQRRTAVSREKVVEGLAEVAERSSKGQGRGLCFLLEASSSPSRMRLQGMLSEKYPEARWFIHEPVDLDIAAKVASTAFGRPLVPFYQFNGGMAGAEPGQGAQSGQTNPGVVILSLDCDFLGLEGDNYRHIREFAKGRRIYDKNGSMNRLYAIEGMVTLTGGNADHRLRVPHSQVLPLAARLASEIFSVTGAQVPAEFAAAVERMGAGVGATQQNDSERTAWLVECARDLVAHRGNSLIVAGHRQPAAVHLIALALNLALGNVGRTVQLLEAPERPEVGTLADLAGLLDAGQVSDLVIVGANPAYTAPADIPWRQLQGRAKNVIRLAYYEDESFAGTSWHIPQLHYLESWGDARTADGTLVPVQPLIQPLFEGMTELEFLARLGGLEEVDPYRIVRETFRGIAGDELWAPFLHDGYLAKSAARPIEQGQLNYGLAAEIVNGTEVLPEPTKSSLEILFHRDYSVDDGRYNNNGWLQELPDPISKITWENVVAMSAKTAQALGLYYEDDEDNRFMVPVVRVEFQGRTIQGPLFIQPGLADNMIAVALGYGRETNAEGGTGRVGGGTGFNAYRLRTTGAPYIGAGAVVKGTEREHELASTQNHWSMEGRPIIREANLEQYRENPAFPKRMDLEEPPAVRSLYPNPLNAVEMEALHQWGMSIDLTTCIGCNACVVACQSENNVPIVGKQQVAKSREMHWLRIDRYFSGGVEDPQMVNQPMLCQHCEAAPCENVCPVNATVHDQEGLNLMVYNRCVGTRYCSNNCPYKVRRFNFFDYNKRPRKELYKGPLAKTPEDEWELLKLVKNPDVTVRMRGVMEKCTFCVQRIEQAKIAQKVKAGASDDVVVPDGTFTTACAQACPADSIVFGNIKDPNSRVSVLKAQQQDYAVLEFLYTRPRLTYLARVRNPNPRMPDYHKMPLAAQEYTDAVGHSPFEAKAHATGGHTEGGEGHVEKGKH